MKHEVIDVFEKECEENPDNMTLRMICNHVVEKLQHASEDVLKNILNKKLTLNGAIGEMRKVAEKRKSGSCAVLSDEEGFKIIDEYFGISGAAAKTVSLADLM